MSNVLKCLLTLGSILFYLFSFSQSKLPDNWFLLSPDSNKVMGSSTNFAFETLLKEKKSNPVIVAIIDDGVDINHPDLKNKIWINTKEIAGNGIDDDKNGYIDDINGWNFIGGKTENVDLDNLEVVRIVKSLGPRFEGKTSVPKSERADFNLYVAANTYLQDTLPKIKASYAAKQKKLDWLNQIRSDIGRDSISNDDIVNYSGSDTSMLKEQINLAKALTTKSFSTIRQDVTNAVANEKKRIEYHYNLDYDPRSIVGDNYADANERYYGNNQVDASNPSHGTHVAGIIGAERNNGIGMDGVAENVYLMVLRAIPDGDERDKDIANAIIYAADNGASIINMSFGKSWPIAKEAVDAAVKYACEKDILFIHAAGNEAKDLDNKSYQRYPNPRYKSLKGDALNNWIEVGANASDGNPGAFSNYGKNYVDVFAPGVKIYSTLPENQYGNRNGTSMAAPVVAGIAAIIRSTYPKLKAKQVKDAITQSVNFLIAEVKKPGNKSEMILWKDLCKSSGVVNTYKAILYSAEQLK